MTLHNKGKHSTTERFSGLARTYALGRPSYPKEAIDFIIEHYPLKEGDMVADIGCGTGISSRLFAKHQASGRVSFVYVTSIYLAQRKSI